MPQQDHNNKWTITKVEHDNCDLCLDMASTAAVLAVVSGDTGCTYGTNAHYARVVRGHHDSPYPQLTF